jgi:hypothetical protein
VSRHRVVVIGSGFGGLTATKGLKHAPVDITMISRTQHHLFQGLLYQVATGILSEGEIAPATRTILGHQRNVEVLLGDEVVAEGVSTPEDVDRMWQINTGSAAGPFRLMDQVGLDVVLDIEEHYCAEHPEYPEGPRRVLRDYVQRGRLGVKSGAGFYDYPDD